MHNILIINDGSTVSKSIFSGLDQKLYDLEYQKSLTSGISQLSAKKFQLIIICFSDKKKFTPSFWTKISKVKGTPLLILIDDDLEDSNIPELDGQMVDIMIRPSNHPALLLHKIKLFTSLSTQDLPGEKPEAGQDIASLKSRLTNAEKKYRTLFNKSNDAQFIANIKGQILDSNQNASKLLGFTQKEFRNKSLRELHPNRQNNLSVRAVRELGEKGNFKLESHLLHKDGKKLTVEISGTTIDIKPEKIIQVAVKDITRERSILEELLTKNRAVESANDGILITDPHQPDNPIIYSNLNFQKITGYNKKDLIGKNCRILQGAETDQTTVQKLREAIKECKPIKCEILNYRKDGSSFWNLLSINPVFNDKNEVINFIGVQHDITDQKKASQELKDFEKFFSTGLELLCITGMDGYFKKVNPALKAALGYSNTELFSTPFIELVHPSDLKKSQKEVERLIEGKPTISVENRLRCKNGDYIYIQWNAIPDVKAQLMYATGRDVTAERIKSIALENSEKGLNESQKLAHVGNWEWHIKSRKSLIWSREQYRIYGFKLTEKISTEKFLNRIHPEDRKILADQDWTKVLSSKAVKKEYRIVHPQKGIRHIYSLGLPIKNPDGEITKVIGTDQDITERKLFENQLRESQRKWHSLFNNANDVVQILDKDFSVLDINHLPPNLTQKGITSKTYIGSNYFEFVLNGREIWRSIVADLQSSGIAYFNRIEGGKYYFKCNIIPLTSEGSTDGYIVIETDITEEKEQENKLIESENRLKTAIASAPIPLMIHDEDGKIYRISRGWEKYSGYSLDKIPTIERWTQFAFGEEQKVSKAYIDNLFAYNETINNGEAEITDNNGKKRTWNFHSTPLGYLDNGKRLILSTAVDLSKSKSAENEIKRLNKNLEKTVETRTRALQYALKNIRKTQAQLIQQEKMASLGLLTAGLAHEINNPMNFIYAGINNLERIVRDIKPVIELYRSLHKSNNVPDKLGEIAQLKSDCAFEEKINTIPELLGDIKLGAERTTEVVKGLRTFSRLDKNEKKPYNIHEGLDSSLMLLQNRITDDIIIKKKYNNKIGLVNCFPSQLNQVFLNILSNAIEAMDGKGKLTIETGLPFGKPVISIKDNGIGMTKKTKSKIFDPFYTTKEVGKGVGLGLSISYGIIEKHGGEIMVISAPKRGTEFRIKLPKS
ncbi:MAG: PAS domain S-box protein [Cyclobacteriaceae bacterium]